MKKAEIANGLLPYFSDYQESIAKEKSYAQKAVALTETWMEKKQVFTFAQKELRKIEEDKQQKKPVWEQKKNNLFDALKLADEKNVQKKLLNAQKKTGEEIKEKLLDAP